MVIRQKLTRWNRFFLAIILLFSGSLPLFSLRSAGAYELMTERYIRISSSANGTLTDGQDVTYKVGFKVSDDSQSIGGIVIEFCSNTPIIGDACNAPTGMDVDAANLVFTDVQANLTGFAVDVAESSANRIVLNNGSPVAVASGVAVEFDFGTAAANDGIDNPETTNTTFYARILTYATATGADDYTSADINGPTDATEPLDAGGVALSTAAQITITAKVPEKLTFCVFTSDDTGAPNTCGTGSGFAGNLGGTAVTLGNQNGVLSDVGAYVDKNAKYSVATNALFGVTIRVKGGTLSTSSNVACQTNGSNCGIDAMGDPGSTSTPGTEEFGFCTYADAGTAAGLTPAAPYDSAACTGTTQTSGLNLGPGGDGGATFAFDNDTVDGTRSTYGDDFANKTAGSFSTGFLVFLGNITTTTEPGIYTTTLTFIATGTY